MTSNRLKTYERLFLYIAFLALVLGIISQLTGCDAFELETKCVIDYRYTEAHTEMYARTTDKGVPYYDYQYIPEQYELLWEETYKDGHTERHWRECTRFEYNNAVKELGGVQDEQSLQ